MSTDTDICNLALTHLGERANVNNISVPDSANAEQCARFYPIARDALLEMHAWRFATRRATLSEMSAELGAWAYAYALPADCLRILAVLPAGGGELDCVDYESESTAAEAPLILTNEPTPVLRYVATITDATKFTPLFVVTLSWLLAGYLAGPVIKGEAGKTAGKECQAEFWRQFAIATSIDANQRQGDPRADEAQAPWIAGR